MFPHTLVAQNCEKGQEQVERQRHSESTHKETKTHIQKKNNRSADKMQSVFNKATESGDSLPRRSFPKIQKFSLPCKIELISSRKER